MIPYFVGLLDIKLIMSLSQVIGKKPQGFLFTKEATVRGSQITDTETGQLNLSGLQVNETRYSIVPKENQEKKLLVIRGPTRIQAEIFMRKPSNHGSPGQCRLTA
jgi:hypothetical protein